MEFATASGTGNAIQSYGPAGFTVNGQLHASNLLISPSFVAAMQGDSFTIESLSPLLESMPKIEVLILGTGSQLVPVVPALRDALREKGISVDAMDTGAACRTYAVLHSEARRVGAALRLA